jgi:uncharacterized protein (TIGR02391 family)
MTDKSNSPVISGLKDVEVFLALKRICRYLVDEAWNTSSDSPEYEFAIAKSHEFERDIKMLADIDEGLAYGQMKRKTKEGAWISKNAGDLNPWYEGELTLHELLNSIEPLVDEIESTSPKYMPEAEFVHYYYYLKYVKDKLPSIILNNDEAEIRFKNLHTKIQQHCEDRYYDRQYSDAILAAYKVVLNEIKDVANIHDLDGKPLVEKAFSISNHIIKLNDLATQSDKDEQLGFMMLFSGAAVGIRNPKAHDLVVQEDRLKTLRYLTFASLLLERLDERKSPKVEHPA